MEHRGEPSPATFLNQYSSQLHSKCLTLYPQVNVNPTSLQRIIFCTYRHHCRNFQLVKMERMTVGYPALTDTLEKYHRIGEQKDPKTWRSAVRWWLLYLREIASMKSQQYGSLNKTCTITRSVGMSVN